MTKSAGYYDLRQAFGEPGCALCRLLAQVADGYVDGVLWELRQELKQTNGYCRDHAWLRGIEAVSGAPAPRAKWERSKDYPDA